MTEDPMKYLNGDVQRTGSLTTTCPLWPYLEHSVKQSESKLDPIPKLEKQEKRRIIEGYVKNLACRLLNTAKNVLVIERSVFNSAHKSNIDNDRFEEILSENSSYLLDILQAYPELKRLLDVITQNFVCQTNLLAQRFAEDRKSIGSLLGHSEPISLQMCEPSQGETHNGSLVVCMLEFEHNARVIYKPRDTVLEHQVSSLMIKMAKLAGGDYDGWRLPNYVNKNGYGWCSYIEHLPAASLHEVEIFYKRAGFLLGLYTSFTAADITSDNLIANGPNPVPIDLETAFYNVLVSSS